MKELYEVLEDMSEMLTKKLMEAREKAHIAGSLSSGDIEYLDKLLHSIKSIKTTMAMIDSEDGGSFGGNSERWSNRSYRSYSDSYGDGESEARGRGRYAKRDSMGRYSSRMSNHGGFERELRELMADAPNEQIREEMRKLIQQVE